jgi:hypothetical protein
MQPDVRLLSELSHVLCDVVAGADQTFRSGDRLAGISGLDLILRLSILRLLLEAAECCLIFSDETFYFFLTSIKLKLYEKGIFIGHDGRIAGWPRSICRWRQGKKTGLHTLYETKLHRR